MDLDPKRWDFMHDMEPATLQELRNRASTAIEERERRRRGGVVAFTEGRTTKPHPTDRPKEKNGHQPAVVWGTRAEGLLL